MGVQKSELHYAILNTAKTARSFHAANNLKVDDYTRIDTAYGIFADEVDEFINKGFYANNTDEIIDGLIDSLFTISEFSMILDSNTSLYTKEYDYDLGMLEGEFKGLDLPTDIEGFVKELQPYTEDIELTIQDDSFIFHVVCAGIVLLDRMGYDMVTYLNTVNASNMSKFPLVSSVSDPKEIVEAIIADGRYTGVNYKVVQLDGESRYVFTANKDLESGKDFPTGKVIKHSSFFIEPVFNK